MPSLTERLTTSVQNSESYSGIQRDVIHGAFDDPNVTTDNGPVKPLAKVLSELGVVASYLRVWTDITGLTGGTSTDLDGRATLNGAVAEGQLIFITSLVSGEVHMYLYKSGINTETDPTIILPDDYNVSTNAFYYERIGIIATGAEIVASQEARDDSRTWAEGADGASLNSGGTITKSAEGYALESEGHKDAAEAVLNTLQSKFPLPSSELDTSTDAAKIQPNNLSASVSASFGTSSFAPANQLSTHPNGWNPGSDVPALPTAASAGADAWIQASIAGTSSSANYSGSLDKADYLKSDGTSWIRYRASQAIVNSDSVTEDMIQASVKEASHKVTSQMVNGLFDPKKETLWTDVSDNSTVISEEFTEATLNALGIKFGHAPIANGGTPKVRFYYPLIGDFDNKKCRFEFFLYNPDGEFDAIQLQLQESTADGGATITTLHSHSNFDYESIGATIRRYFVYADTGTNANGIGRFNFQLQTSRPGGSSKCYVCGFKYWFGDHNAYAFDDDFYKYRDDEIKKQLFYSNEDHVYIIRPGDDAQAIIDATSLTQPRTFLFVGGVSEDSPINAVPGHTPDYSNDISRRYHTIYLQPGTENVHIKGIGHSGIKRPDNDHRIGLQPARIHNQSGVTPTQADFDSFENRYPGGDSTFSGDIHSNEARKQIDIDGISTPNRWRYKTTDTSYNGFEDIVADQWEDVGDGMEVRFTKDTGFVDNTGFDSVATVDQHICIRIGNGKSTTPIRNVTIEDMVIDGNVESGRLGENVTINNYRVNPVLGDLSGGILIHGECHNVVIKNNHFKNCQRSIMVYGGYSGDEGEVTGTPTSGGVGTYYNPNNILIENNFMDDALEADIFGFPAHPGEPDNIVYRNNQIVSKKTKIEINYGAKRVIVTGNRIGDYDPDEPGPDIEFRRNEGFTYLADNMHMNAKEVNVVVTQSTSGGFPSNPKIIDWNNINLGMIDGGRGTTIDDHTNQSTSKGRAANKLFGYDHHFDFEDSGFAVGGKHHANRNFGQVTIGNGSRPLQSYGFGYASSYTQEETIDGVDISQGDLTPELMHFGADIPSGGTEGGEYTLGFDATPSNPTGNITGMSVLENSYSLVEIIAVARSADGTRTFGRKTTIELIKGSGSTSNVTINTLSTSNSASNDPSLDLTFDGVGENGNVDIRGRRLNDQNIKWSVSCQVIRAIHF